MKLVRTINAEGRAVVRLLPEVGVRPWEETLSASREQVSG